MIFCTQCPAVAWRSGWATTSVHVEAFTRNVSEEILLCRVKKQVPEAGTRSCAHVHVMSDGHFGRSLEQYTQYARVKHTSFPALAEDPHSHMFNLHILAPHLYPTTQGWT